MKMKVLGQVAGMAFVAVVYWLLLGFVQEDLVQRRVEPIGMRLPEWLLGFRFWGRTGILISLAAGLFWYLLAQWKFKIDFWKDSRRRVAWALFFLLPAAAAIGGAYFTSSVKEGAWVTNVFFGFNALTSYYFETALFSPSAFKYTPIGAQRVRVWEMAFTFKLRRTDE